MELTEWEVDQMGIDEVGIDKVGIDKVGINPDQDCICSQNFPNSDSTHKHIKGIKHWSPQKCVQV